MKNKCLDVFSNGVRYSVLIDAGWNYTLERENQRVGSATETEPISKYCAFAIRAAFEHGVAHKEKEIRRVLGIEEK